MKTNVLVKLFVCLSIWLCGCVQVSGQDCGTLFRKANTLRHSGRYAGAIEYYQRVKNCGDASYRKDCDKWISWCQGRLPRLSLSENVVRLPFQGGEAWVGVSARGSWKVTEGYPDWCDATVTASGLTISCASPNNALQERAATLTVRSGRLSRKLKVVQEARPEYVEASTSELFLPAEGAVREVAVESNAVWEVAAFPSWCKVERDSARIRIVAEANENMSERSDSVRVVSSNSAFTIRICQSAREERLILSLASLQVPAKGGTFYAKVTCDADTWYVSDFPNWCDVRPENGDSIRIRVKRNARKGEARQGFVTICTERQSVSLQVEQAQREKPAPQDTCVSNLPDTHTVGGRNVSFGVAADFGCAMWRYRSYNNGATFGETAKRGLWAVGGFVDIRLHKNYFLTAGVNYRKSNSCDYIYRFKGYSYWLSPAMLEIPLIASYRYRLGGKSHVQANFGPVIDFGLSFKGKEWSNGDTEKFSFHGVGANSFNFGLQVGAAYEIHGVSFGVSYTTMLTRMFDVEDYPGKRHTLRLRSLSFRLAYTFRYRK